MTANIGHNGGPKLCPHCECALPTVGGKPRSHPQLGRYMKAIRIAYDNWPEQHRSQFSEWKELRYWLQVKAGYGEVTARIPVTGLGADISKFIAQAAIKAAGGYAVPIVRGADLVIVKPLSINYTTLPHEKFNELNDKVDREISAVLGLNMTELIQGQRSAA